MPIVGIYSAMNFWLGHGREYFSRSLKFVGVKFLNPYFALTIALD